MLRTKNWKIFITICILSIGCYYVIDISAEKNTIKKYLQPPGICNINKKSRSKLTIPFDMYGMNVMINGKLNGKNVKLLIDNGVMWNDLWFYNSKLFEKIKIPLSGDVDIDGAGEGDGIQSYYATNLSLKIGNIQFLNQNAIVTPESQGIAKMFKGVDGQICGTLFNHFTVQFNFQRKIITLIKPESFKYSGNGIKIKMTDNGIGSFSIPVKLVFSNGKTVKENLFIDLGGIYPVSLAINKLKGIEKPQTKKVYLAHGASGPIYGYKSKLKAIHLGNCCLKSVETTFIESKNGGDHTNMTIGLPLLMNFKVTFDYFNRIIYLEPYKNMMRSINSLKYKSYIMKLY